MNYIFHSMLAILMGSVFKGLLCAFRETADAGVDRLREKYPGLERSRSIYEKNWRLLETALSLAAVIFQIAGIVLLFIATRELGFDKWIVVVVFVLLAVVSLVLFEILPNIVARVYSDRLSALALPMTIVIAYTLGPLLIPLRYMGGLLEKHMLLNADADDRPKAEDEIISLMEQAGAQDMELHEKEFIRSVFEFDDTDVHEIMTPRIEVEAIEDTESVSYCVARIRDIPHSRFPVYHQSLDNIQGLIHVKELMRMLSLGRGEELVGRVAGEANFVPESMKIAKLFELMKERRAHLAVVVDEYGGTAGVVALENVIEELIGDIQDESDKEMPGVLRLPDGSVMIQAREPVDEVNEMIGIDIPESDQYDSVGGYIFSQLNRIPESGETVEGSNFKITIQKASERQVKTVRIAKF